MGGVIDEGENTGYLNDSGAGTDDHGGDGAAGPALAVIDKAGKIRLMHYADSMNDIPTDQEVLSLLDELNKESM